jgi:pimeloyl-ACP methyl ester carboxylesterase
MRRRLFVIAIGLMLAGSFLAHQIQTSNGVTVTEVRFDGLGDIRMSALLYVPENASEEHPAPGILAIHGYINSRETQSGFAIEFARRGYVVLALDQTGHGYSDPPAFANGFGGPDGLRYLRSLRFVDKQKIGLEGHSMGGWAVQMAAAAAPTDYEAMVLAGSSTGTFGAPDGTKDSPKNLLLIFSLYDEFSELMWGAETPADIVDADKLKRLFDTQGRIEIGKHYGDLASGNARKLEMPPVTHPGDHLSVKAIGASIKWFDLTLQHDSQLNASEQIWYWKEFGTLIALIGVALLIFPLVDLMASLAVFNFAFHFEKPQSRALINPSGLRLNIALTMSIPVITFFPLQTVANMVFPASSLFPQQITNGVLLWAWGTGLVTMGLFLFWNRGSGRGLLELGMPANRSIVIKAMFMAISCCAVLYLSLLLADQLMLVDFRFWVVALKLLSPDQFAMFLIYVLPFTLYFLVLSLSLHNPLRQDLRPGKAIWVNGLILSGGFIVMLLIQYMPLLLGGTLAIASMPLLSTVAFQFVPLLFLVGAVSTFCYQKCGNIYTGAFINGIFVTWYMVAGTATQALPFWY